MKLLTDSTNRAKERLFSAETELAALDETQETKRKNLTATKKELSDAKETMISLQSEDKELLQKEERLGKHHKEIIVSFIR